LPDDAEANGDDDQGEGENVPKQRPVDLLREEEKFSRKPIQQLAIVKEANILVSLSDNYVSIHDLQTYALQEKLERTKGAMSFAVISNIVKDPETGIPSIVSRLAVAVKRKIILWSWRDTELSDDVGEISLIAAVKSLTWATGTKIIAGMDPGFVIVDVDSQEVVDIIRPGSLGQGDAQAGARFGAVNSAGMGYMGMGSWVPKPMATQLTEGEMLLAKDVNSLFIDTNGKPLEKRQVPWASAPEAIGYSYPYLLALAPPTKGTLEVRNPDTLSLLQSVSLPNATFMYVPQPHISLAHAGKGFLVASDRCIWRMGGINYDSQIEQLISEDNYDEAISLLNLLEDALLKDKEGMLREIKILKAQDLFKQRKYRESLDLFSDASAPPASVISLYPRSVAADLSTIEPLEDEQTHDEQDSKSEKGSIKAPSPTATTHGSLTKGMLSRFRAEKKVEDDTVSVKSGKAPEPSDATSTRNKAPGTAVSTDKPLEGRDLTIAINELCAFLAQTRVQLQKVLNKDGTLKEPLPPVEDRPKDYKPHFSHFIVLPPNDVGSIDWAKQILEVATLVDTTLFRAYMIARPGLAGSLFRIDNFCNPDVVNEKLYETGRYAELIDFLHGKKLHREALELLAKFGKDDEADDASSGLRGPQRTVGYLVQLPPELIDLILEFAEWPLRADPAMGTEIFLADTKNAEELPRHRVLDFLQGIDSKLAVQYLEHIINELNDLTPDFHQRLIDLYLDRLNDPSFTDQEERKNWLDRLQLFLKTSTQYNRARAFGRIPADNPSFYESRAIVLSNMGQHKQALQIYVFQIKDYDKAEEYCNHVYLQTNASSTSTSTPTPFLPPTDAPEDAEPNIYHTLLSLYLSPPPPHEPNWPPALTLLSKHGARLPASSTLSLIPSSLPVKDLESYFRGRIRSAVSAMREEAIMARLRGVEKLDVEAKLLLKERNRRVVVGEERVCGVCHKRFGGSAIRVYPDDTVVHYGCLRNRASSGGLAVAGFDGAGRRRGWS
jgi:Vam6/Vps39-like protein vacuolar protein sorting-associated protein 39